MSRVRKGKRAVSIAVACAATLLFSFVGLEGVQAIDGTSPRRAPRVEHATFVASYDGTGRANAAPSGAANVGPSAHTAASETVVLYGDSLSDESTTYFRDALAASGITDVTTRTFGGTALCDWLDDMRRDTVELQPTSVLIEFSGNAFTPCMHDAQDAPLTGAAYFAKYFDDATEALSIFAPTAAQVFFVGAPLSRHSVETHDPNAGLLNDLYAWATLDGHSEYVNAGAAVLDRGTWTETLPCLPNEPCSGTDSSGTPVNVVRAADGVHFCPTSPAAVGGVTGVCPVWSSGAFRFASAMATAVVEHARSQALGARDRR